MSLFYSRDPGADGIGVACTSAASNLSDLQAPDARAAAFDRLARTLGAQVAVVTQVHGRRVVDLDALAAEPVDGLIDLRCEEADALITSRRGVALTIRVADCIPVLFADADAGLVGAAHAGRAGVLQGVLAATVEALRARGASGLRAWIGPHICGACYEVPAEMAADFEQRTGVAPTATRWGTVGLDLGAAARAQLDALGVRYESVEDCTLEHEALHSYRRSAASAGRLAAMIWRA